MITLRQFVTKRGILHLMGSEFSKEKGITLKRG
jgi:hypothetical protein